MPIIRTVLLSVCLLVVVGCGTTHYFVPSRPLESEESAVFVTWHYDLNGLYAPNPVPDVHFYYGVNEDVNLGIGLQAPIYVSHLSAVKYWENGGDWAYGFLHLGQVAGANTNPLVEAGAGYAWHQSTAAEQVELGLVYGNGSASPLAVWPLDMDYAGNKRFMPIGRVMVAGEDAGVSVQYYHGLTQGNLRNLEQAATADWEGPEKVVRGSAVDSIAFYPDSISAMGRSHLVIFLNSGWQFDLFSWQEGTGVWKQDGYPSLLRLMPFDPSQQLPRPVVDTLPLMEFGGFLPNDSGARFLLVNQPFIGGVEAVTAALERREDVPLRSYADVQAEMVRRIRERKRGFWNDLSVGAAVVRYGGD